MASCTVCTKSDVPLKRCAKCLNNDKVYCSRQCQTADWKTHKKTCRAGGSSSSPSSAPPPPSSSANLSPTRGVDQGIAKPFTAIKNGTWLHGRSEKDVYRLLVDCYRMKLCDMEVFDGGAGADTIYRGCSDPIPGFRRFLSLVKRVNLLPAWWADNHAAAIEAFAVTDGFSNLRRRTHKAAIQDQYGEPRFPMQLRMFAERAYGRGPGGQDGTPMLELMASTEGGGGPMVTHLDVNPGFGR